MKRPLPDITNMPIMHADKRWLNQQKKRINKLHKKGINVDSLINQWQQRLAHSLDCYQSRKGSLPHIDYPANLPVCEKIDEIKSYIKNNQVVILSGETGSGKTTQIPKICLDMGYGIAGKIALTQPRRIAARTIANRIASELNQPLGEQVGFKIRFQDKSNQNTLLKVVTDGILLQETQHSRLLTEYEVIIIDEAHERNLNIDFLLGFMKHILPKRPELKLIITSATINVEEFSKHFNQAPILQVSGRCYEVDTHYISAEDLNLPYSSSQEERLIKAVGYIEQLERQNRFSSIGDILIFVATEREIHEARLAFKKTDLKHFIVLPLYSRLMKDQQDLIFKTNSPIRRIIISTNIAETSITVPGIKYVIDTGKARMLQYCYRTRVNKLPIQAISMASAQQRLGRCGRLKNGICLRLYSEQDYLSRPEFTKPEILRTNLSSVILKMLCLDLGEVEKFPFINPPDNRYVKEAYKTLIEIGAIDAQHKVTAHGRLINKIPLDPKLSKMILTASNLGALEEVIIISTALSMQDPRDYPADDKQKALSLHARFKAKDSDFISLLNIWRYFCEIKDHNSHSKVKKICKKEFLSYNRIREWMDLYKQITLIAKDLKLFKNTVDASFYQIHCALLSGLIHNIAKKEIDNSYLGTHNKKLYLSPLSNLTKSKPLWVVYAQSIETQKLIAHQLASIDPKWLIKYAKPLLRNSYYAPNYSITSGRINAKMDRYLYGLPLVHGECVNFEAINPYESRQIFIQQALVEEKIRYKDNHQYPFIDHNINMKQEIRAVENKSRRRDILVDDGEIFKLYDAYIPQDVCNKKQFCLWLHQQDNDKLLCFDKHQLSYSNLADIQEQNYPDSIHWQGEIYPLDYHFDPGAANDGLSVYISIKQLLNLPHYLFEWLVPGLLKEKCIELIRSLPKRERTKCHPITETIDGMLPSLVPGNYPLIQKMAQSLKRIYGITIDLSSFNTKKIPSYYHINFCLINTDKTILDMSKNIEYLRKKYSESHVTEYIHHDNQKIVDNVYTHWEFPEQSSGIIQANNLDSLQLKLSIIDVGSGVKLKYIEDSSQALYTTQKGIARLISFVISKEIKYIEKKCLTQGNAAITIRNQLGAHQKELILSVIIKHFLKENLPSEENSFKTLIQQNRQDFIPFASAFLNKLHRIFSLKKSCEETVDMLDEHQLLDLQISIKNQLNNLFLANFIFLPTDIVSRYCDYLLSIQTRINKAKQNPLKEAQNARLISKYQDFLDSKIEDYSRTNNQFDKYFTLRWMLEEYRMAVFSQELKRHKKVSAKILDKLIEKL